MVINIRNKFGQSCDRSLEILHAVSFNQFKRKKTWVNLNSDENVCVIAYDMNVYSSEIGECDLENGEFNFFSRPSCLQVLKLYINSQFLALR